MSSGLRWLLLGLLGLLIAGAVAFFAIRTVSEKIGISSESPAAGKALAPRPPRSSPEKTSADHGGSTTATTAQPRPSPSPFPAPAPTGGDDYAGGANGGHEGGDD